MKKVFSKDHTKKMRGEDDEEKVRDREEFLEHK